MRFLILYFLIFINLFAFDVTKGKTALLVLPSPLGTVVTADKNLSVLPHPNNKSQGIVFLPIDYYAVAGENNITWVLPYNSVFLQTRVIDAVYPTETLSVDASKVKPPESALEQIEAERMEAENIYNTFTPKRYWDKQFIYPMNSTITSEYGSARTYNGVLKSYHGGVDFRARTPLPIQSTNNGVVVLVKDRYYAGGTIIIDHGEGIYSCYFHLSRFDVKVGDKVSRGDVIGLSGATGRITGPHLHFGMMVHGVQTDPLNLIDQINTLF